MIIALTSSAVLGLVAISRLKVGKNAFATAYFALAVAFAFAAFTG